MAVGVARGIRVELRREMEMGMDMDTVRAEAPISWLDLRADISHIVAVGLDKVICQTLMAIIC